MYNTDLPTRAELPTTAQLLRSTAIAAVSAVAILVTIVLPAEYAIDPTGIGRMLKLTEMGEIKIQLAAEAEADRIKDSQTPPAQPAPAAPAADKRSSLLDTGLSGLFVSPAQAGERFVVAQAESRKDELNVTLKPNEGVEYKMTMVKGAKATFAWEVQGGVVNYDMHGTPWTRIETSYKKGRSVAKDSGVLEAGFDGTHGWFWRNRSSQNVTITLKVEGAYKDLKKM